MFLYSTFVTLYIVKGIIQIKLIWIQLNNSMVY